MKSCLQGCLSFFLTSLALGMFFTLAGLFHCEHQWIEDSFWAPEITRYDSESRKVPTWGYPIGMIIDHPLRGLKGRVDRVDSIYWAYAVFNFISWWFFAIILYGIYCIARAIKRRRTNPLNDAVPRQNATV